MQGERIWISCRDGEVERLAVDRLGELLGDFGLVVEHSALTLHTRRMQLGLLKLLSTRPRAGRRVLLVRRLDRLSAARQSRLCGFLAGGRIAADCIVATCRKPHSEHRLRGLTGRIERCFRPMTEVDFDTHLSSRTRGIKPTGPPGGFHNRRE
jgi:hypothetical protein